VHSPFDIVFVVTEAAHVGYNGFAAMKRFAALFVGRFDIDSRTTRVALVVYSEGVDATKCIYLKRYASVRPLQSAIGNRRYAGGGTMDTHAALEFVRTLVLTARLGDRSNVSNAVVVLMYGRSSRPDSTRVSVKPV